LRGCVVLALVLEQEPMMKRVKAALLKAGDSP
jgi:hypothetical protein